MNTPITTDTAQADAKRWRAWQLKNEHDERKGARRARLAFTALFIVLAIWLAVRLAYSQLG